MCLWHRILDFLLSDSKTMEQVVLGQFTTVRTVQEAVTIACSVPKSWFCMMKLSHWPFRVRALGCPRDALPPASSVMSHAKDETLACASASQRSIPQQPSWNSSPYFWIQLGNNYNAVVALAFGRVTNNQGLNAKRRGWSAPVSGYGEQTSK